MKVKLSGDWNAFLKEEFEKEYFSKIAELVKIEYHKYTCFPNGNKIFRALDECRLEDVKVVILGQDPYHGLGQANGLCFSVSDGIPFPPSLKNIFLEIKNDLGIDIPTSGDLIRWSRQGVLLLNSCLTVRENEAGSHKYLGWEYFTDQLILSLSDFHNHLIFLLWGGYAKKKQSLISKEKHCILTSGHPSPLSANKGHWFGNKHFSAANEQLVKWNMKPIEW